MSHRPTSFQAAFASRVAEAPAAVAIYDGDRAVRYAELDSAAQDAARRLAACGVGPRAYVGLIADRSAEALIGMLAIHLAGAAFVPAVPDQPEARTRAAFRRAGVSAIVATAAHRDAAVRCGDGVPVLAIGDETEMADTVHIEPASPDDPAYVVFTSGSTGEPKGVIVRRRSLASYTDAILGLLGPSTQPRTFATTATIAADLGYTAIFPALASGAAVCIIGYDEALDGRLFATRAARTPIDVLKITPSNLRALLASASDPRAILPRETLVCGGEALSWNLVDEVRALAPQCAVVNHYGPTEATVGTLAYRVPAQTSAARDASVPLGSPLAGAAAYVLDPAGARCGAGTSGELYIGGAGVAAGYVADPTETEKRFLPDPFAPPAPGSVPTMYRTGDRIRIAEDGSYVFAGRFDDQVKVRGFRVEPSEIAAALRRPGVDDAAIVARPAPDGDATLHAYVAGRNVDVAALQTSLAEQLPAYMMPSTWTVLDALPLTPNGKVDRNALPAPAAERAPDDGDEERTPTETEFAAIVCGVLERTSIGLDDDFFDAGGHSLLATVVVARARRAFGVALPLRTFFEGPTVRAVSAAIDEAILAQIEAMSDEEAERMASGSP